MATAKPNFPPQTRRRRQRRIALLLGLGVLVALAVAWKPLSSQARAAASYGARVGCGCHYIAGRELSDCRRDFLPGMGLVMLGSDADARSVTAWYPPFAHQTATFREGEGCVLERWED